MSTRTLVILRHAKAANPEGAMDADRPLTDRGHADAAAAGAWLAHVGYAPDLVLCSSARRTRETWHGAALALPAGAAVRFSDELYSASVVDLLALVNAVDDDLATVLMIGHNPSVSQLSSLLDPDEADPDGLRTAGLAVHSWDGSWADCDAGAAPLATTHTARA